MEQRNIGTENEESRMVRIRIPEYVYWELSDLANSRKMNRGRLMIEILRSVAEKQIQSRIEVDKDWENLTP